MGAFIGHQRQDWILNPFWLWRAVQRWKVSCIVQKTMAYCSIARRSNKADHNKNLQFSRWTSLKGNYILLLYSWLDCIWWINIIRLLFGDDVFYGSQMMASSNIKKINLIRNNGAINLTPFDLFPISQFLIFLKL